MLFFQCVFFIQLYFGMGELKVNLSNLQSTKGQVLLAIYDSADSYMHTDRAVALKSIELKNVQPVDVVFSGLKPGVYAVTVVHDLNKNGKIDTNMFGVPTEPYGFSNNKRPKFRSASWDESKFSLDPNKTNISIRLDTW